MKTPSISTASQKLEQIESYIKRNYIEPYGKIDTEQLTEAMQGKLELAYTIKHILDTI